MWGRLWRIDTLFEAGQLPVISRELADLASCAGRVQAPVARWHEASGMAAVLDQFPPQFLPGGSYADTPLTSVLPTVNLALMWLERGDRDQAARMYELAHPVRSWRPIPALRLIAWAQGLAAAIGLGRTDDIAYLASEFEPLRGRHVACGAGAGDYLGPVELHLGKAAAALGSLEQAVADLTAAATDAQHLGMAPFSRRIEGLRARPPAGPPQLSQREREVARLVGQGLTNRQIAAALYVSERTAQNHVQHILTKLGFANRSQIAVWSTAPPAPPAE